MSRKLIVENPATNEACVELDMMGDGEVRDIIVKAQEAHLVWRDVPVKERVAVTERFIEALKKNKERIAEQITRQMGKPLWQARNEVDGCARRAAYMASVAEESLRDVEIAEGEGVYKKIVQEPRGVTVDIASWNYPLLVAVNVVTPSVLAGNAVVLKHSSYTPLCGLVFEEMYREAGAPEGLVKAVVADRTASAALFASPLVKAVFFTGSVEGGYQVNRQASAQLADVGLELGGKDPAYIRADADLDSAAPSVADAAFYNTGQSCCAVERVYVHESVYEPFLERFLEAVKGFKLGDPMEEGTYIGPLTQKKQLSVLEKQVEEAVSRGATLRMGGARTSVNGKGNYYQATVLTEATNDMLVMQEESFGPIIGLIPVRDDDHAVKLMNDSDFGLSASVWTRDREAAMRLAPRIQAGTVLMNRADAVDPDLAWTGVKESGKGCTLSKLGFRALTQLKSYNFKF